MSYKIGALAILVLSVVGLASCEKELNINADYQRYAIIYGLLNQYDSVQVIKINRSFLGDADPTGYAKTPDSTLFENVVVDLVEYVNGNESNRYPLQKEIRTNKEPGIFHSPEQVVYTAKLPKTPPKAGESEDQVITYLREPEYTAAEISARYEYRLEGTLDGEPIKATMSAIPERFNGSYIFYQTSYRSKWNQSGLQKGIAFATSSGLTDGLYMPTQLPPLTKIAELKMIFNYTDYYVNGDSVNQQIVQSMGTTVVPKLSETNYYEYEFKIGSERFFELVASQVPDFNPSELTRRQPGIVDFKLILGDNEYYYYRENTLPSDDLNQLKPQYTNIEGGFGIFASRMEVVLSDWAIGTQRDINTTASLKGMNLSKETQIALHEGSITNSSTGETIELGTAAKGFCVDPEMAGVHPGNCK